jgi:hypothetical protein
MPILVYFVRPWDGKVLSTSLPFGIFIAIPEYYMAIRYFCGHFGTFFPILMFCAQKIWQPRIVEPGIFIDDEVQR